MPYKYLKILRYIKYHPTGTSTNELIRVFENTPIFINKYENVALLIHNLVEQNYCRGIEATVNDRDTPMYSYTELTITHKGESALNWINWIPLIKDIIGLFRELTK